MSFGPVPSFDLIALEERVLARWRQHDVVELVRKARADAEPWIFYEGPPSANGRPGFHHVWARAFKDLYPRFQTMRGKQVPRQGGWDCHGLPVELAVEQELGFTAKHQIEEYGIAEFNQRCRDSVSRHVEDWSALTERTGVWIDTKTAYWTLSNEFIESVWWLLKQLFDRGLLYEGHRVSPYCTRCGTALSSHEMGQPDVYQDVTDQTAYVRFPVAGEDYDLVVWTTTPWTLISNVAAAVGPEIEYVQVHEPDGRDLVMARAAADRIFGADGGANVVATFRGTDLVGKHYERPFAFLDVKDTDNRVVADEYVTVEDGSGIVHLAGAFGEQDAVIVRREGMTVLNPVTADGTFDERVKPWWGVHVKAADRGILDDLMSRGLLVREEPYTHSYPHCWRCKSPLIYWAKTSWFARTSEHRDALLRENEKIGWYPETMKRGRFGKWLEGNIDWALSRDRYWGTPIPIWRCRDGHDTCIGSVAELSSLAGRELTDLDLHRPYVDDITIDCPQCDGRAQRVLPVLDVWFDSGSMPTAQQHFPFEGQDPSVPPAFPADFICEAVDQTRGWFYSLLAVNTLVFGETPYRNVVVLGHLVDAEGRKMSKSLGNVIDPWHFVQQHGADGTRWWMFSAGQPWSSRRVHDEQVRESTRQTLLTLWNVWSFFATYADLEGWQPGGAAPTPTHVLDRWILSELSDIVGEVTDGLESFDALRASSRVARFVDDLSNWYVRRSRPRFWKSSDADAFSTLYTCLKTTAELLAPFTPFLADELWTALTGETSVHAADWPAAGPVDAALSAEMAAARQLVSLGRAARTEAKVKVRQPLRRAWVLHPGVTLSDEVTAEIEQELNVHRLEHIDSLGGLVQRTVTPSFRALGPRLGPKVNEVKQALAAADGTALADQLEAQGHIEVAGERITADEVEVRADTRSDVALAQEGTFAVALDLELDDDLRVEGRARELVRAINDLRKEQGFAIADRVTCVLDGDVATVVDAHGDTIAAEVLATSLTVGTVDDAAPTVDLDGTPVKVALTRA